MRDLRPAAVAAMLLALAACGGGGSGASVPGVIGNPGPTPVSSMSPSPVPTSSTTPDPPTPSPSPTATPTPVTIVANGSTVFANDGTVNGTVGAFPDGDTADGGTGQALAPNLSCTLTGEATTGYHVNIWLGFMVNGKEMAGARATGMVNPRPPAPGSTIVEHAQCFYQIHNHDWSGTYHLEDPNSPPSNTAEYTLADLFKVWGNGPQTSHWPFSGPVTVYAGTPTSSCCNGNDIVGKYTSVNQYMSLPLAKHTAVWIVVGALPASGLPQLEFTMEQ